MPKYGQSTTPRNNNYRTGIHTTRNTSQLNILYHIDEEPSTSTGIKHLSLAERTQNQRKKLEGKKPLTPGVIKLNHTDQQSSEKVYKIKKIKDTLMPEPIEPEEVENPAKTKNKLKQEATIKNRNPTMRTEEHSSTPSGQKHSTLHQNKVFVDWRIVTSS